jgi:hypothetical protein
MTDKRPDEIDDFRIHLPDGQNDSLNEIELQVDIIRRSSEQKNRSGCFRRFFLRIFCGYEQNELINDESNEKMLKKQTENESRRRVNNFYSLNRTKFERYVLNINLCIILMIATGLYVFFSVPHKLYQFEYNALNATFL